MKIQQQEPYPKREETTFNIKKQQGPETVRPEGGHPMEGPKHKIVIFHNRRRKVEKHPHLFGSVNIDGKEYKIAMWETKSKNGDLTYYHGVAREAYF
jgi:hypothetical protein